MWTRLGKRSGHGAIVLVLIASLLSQGCIVAEKRIIDVYTAIYGVPVGVPVLVSEMSFGSNSAYCFGDGSVKMKVKLSATDVALTALLVQAVVSRAGGQIITQNFQLNRKNGKFKGNFPVTGTCVNPGDTLQWYVTPIGAAILGGVSMKSDFFYRPPAI